MHHCPKLPKDWNNILYDAMRGSNSIVCVSFFVTWVILGQFVLLNLFLAVLLENFGKLSRDSNLFRTEDNDDEKLLLISGEGDGDDERLQRWEFWSLNQGHHVSI